MSYNESMQELWHQYQVEHGEEPATIQECYEWAMNNRKWQPKPLDVAKIFNREMSNALRQQYRVDASGRRYRAKVCIKEKLGPVQIRLWGDADKASDRFIERSVQERRRGIANVCFQLKQDVDHANEYRALVQISLVLDFAEDVAELEALNRIPPEDEDDPDDPEEQAA